MGTHPLFPPDFDSNRKSVFGLGLSSKSKLLKNEVIRIIWELSFEVVIYMYIYPGSDCYVWAYIQNVKKKIEIKFFHHQPLPSLSSTIWWCFFSIFCLLTLIHF